jgi:hypothetical protein
MDKQEAIKRMRKYKVKKTDKKAPKYLNTENVRKIIDDDLSYEDKIGELMELVVFQEQEDKGMIFLPSSPEDRELAEAIISDAELMETWKKITNQ